MLSGDPSLTTQTISRCEEAGAHWRVHEKIRKRIQWWHYLETVTEPMQWGDDHDGITASRQRHRSELTPRTTFLVLAATVTIP